MSQYSRILVGLDLSDDSETVLAKAQQIAKDGKAEILVAHIIEPLAFAYGGDVPVDLSEAQNVMETQARKRMTNICSAHDIPSDNQVITLGQTATELHTLAEERKVDLIVVGTHGRHGLAALFGNTVNGVIRGADCDVLAIKV